MAIDLQTWVHVASYLGAGSAIGLGAIGAALGEGNTAQCANAALSRNPNLMGEIFQTMLVGQAVTESAAIFALVVAILLLFTDFAPYSYLTVCVLFSAGLTMGIGAIGSGIGSGFPAGAACTGIERQRSANNVLNSTMLIGSAITQTTSIYALVTAFILIFTDFSQHPLSPTWAALLGAGLATGLSAMGPAIGEGLVAQSGCDGIARQPESAGTTMKVMLLSMAVTETTGIYGLLISFILLFKQIPEVATLTATMALLGAGLCMGLGAIGPGMGEGITGSYAVKWVSRNSDSTAEITRVMLVGQAVAESTGIYSMVIALVLIFVI